MTLDLVERIQVAPPRPVSASTQFIYGESEAGRYETPASEQAVGDSVRLVNPELGLFRQMSGFTSIPPSTPMSASIISASGAFSLRLSKWVEASMATVMSIELRESPFSSWPILDAIRRSGHPRPSLAWPSFLARLSLLALDETPTTAVRGITSLPHFPDSDIAGRDDVMTAISSVQTVLGLTTEELSAATGVGLRTLRRWRSPHAVRPRRRTVRAVWRLYVTASALKNGLGVQGVATWIHVGSPSPMDLLAAGDLATFERLARSRILTGERESRLYAGFAVEPSSEDEAELGQFRRATRRPTRGRLRAR